jgi:signal transduction histidine kinase
LRAWNVDGVPSTHDETVRFRVLPAWYETSWSRGGGVLLFALACVAGALGVQRRAAQRSAAMLRSQFEATLAERSRIARELHDTLLQEFTGVTLLLEAFGEKLSRSRDAALDELPRILTLAERSLSEARQSVWDMRSPTLDGKGLAEALEELGRAAAPKGTTHLRCTVSGAGRALQPRIETTVLHIAREAIRNAVKHAQAQTVDVELTYGADRVTLAVSDDGIGMTEDRPEEASKDGHFGIVGMRERAASAGGSLVVTGIPGKVTRVELVLPSAQ